MDGEIIEYQVESISKDRWGNVFVYLREGEELKKYPFAGCKGKFKVRKFIPERCRTYRVELIGS